jgi:flagellar basal body P-ring protein FlgI
MREYPIPYLVICSMRENSLLALGMRGGGDNERQRVAKLPLLSNIIEETGMFLSIMFNKNTVLLLV